MKLRSLLFIGIVFLFAYGLTSGAYNFEYVNVTSEVNITNAYPLIDSVSLPSSVTLSAGTTTLVYCNVTAIDWEGWDDITGLNATLWDNDTVSMGDPDNNNNHYTNSSCTNTGNDGNYTVNFTCAFDVWYFANNGSNWICNATVIDTNNLTGSGYNTTQFPLYYALNVTPVIDYGDLTLGSYSPNISANISNVGNGQINISVRGYGQTPDDGLAMVCLFNNITIENERFSANASAGWAAKTNLSSSLKNITGLSVPKRTVGPTWDLTYWQLYVDPSNTPFGECNGTVEFNAIAG